MTAGTDRTYTDTEIAVAAAVAAERERCAKVAEKYYAKDPGCDCSAGLHIAHLIRSGA